jgi:hypothetical protein
MDQIINWEQKKKTESASNNNQGRLDWDEESCVFSLSIRLFVHQFKLHYTQSVWCMILSSEQASLCKTYHSYIHGANSAIKRNKSGPYINMNKTSQTPTAIREVQSSNYDPRTQYPDMSLAPSLNPRMSLLCQPWSRPKSIHSALFPIYYSTIIL